MRINKVSEEILNNTIDTTSIISNEKISIWGDYFSDKNNNNLVDAFDFDNSVDIVEKLEKHNLIGKLWTDVRQNIQDLLYDENINDLNGEIGDFEQGLNGDCEILISLKSLSLTPWGKNAIKEAVKLDGKGGATVTFKGALGKKNTFHISKKTLKRYEKFGLVSEGDKDVPVIEIALKKYLKMKMTGNLTNEALYKYTDDYSLETIETLIFGQNLKFIQLSAEEDNMENAYNLITKYKNNCTYSIAFKNQLNDDIVTNHAYTVIGTKTVNDEEFLILLNPWGTKKEIYISKQDFCTNIKSMFATMPQEVSSTIQEETGIRAVSVNLKN